MAREDRSPRASPAADSAAATLDAAVAFMLLMFVPVVAQLILVHGLGFRREAVSRADCGGMIYMFGIVLLCVFAGLRHGGLALRARGNLGFAAASYLLFMVAWVPLALILYPMLVRAGGAKLPPQEMLRHVAEAPLTPGLVLLLILACIMAPIGEELFFRGYLFRAMQLRTDRRLALVATSVLFGIVHGYLYAVPLTVMGLFFGWLRMRTGGLAAPILAHMLHNTLTVTCTLIWPGLVKQVFDPAGS